MGAQVVAVQPDVAGHVDAFEQHLDAATPNSIIQEWLQTDVEWRDELMGGPFEIAEGYMALPKGPGLGIDLNLEVIQAHPYAPRDMNLYSRPGVVPRERP